jgi:S1-C subfamily serine protease
MQKLNRISIILFIVAVFILGASAGLVAGKFSDPNPVTADDLNLDEQEATIRAINKTRPAVVSIQVFEEIDVVNLDVNAGVQKITTEKENKGNGSGFIFTPDGLIITNRHVVDIIDDEDKAEYKVKLVSGKEYYAQLIDKDPLKDLAVLKIFDKDLPYIELGDSRDLMIGQTVIALGNPLSRYPGTANKGIVSGLNRYLVTNQFTTPQAQSLDNVIQIDAEINRGSSGGPLIDLEGKVVGINVALDNAGNSIAFAIPILDVEPVIRTIKASGQIIRPRIGVRYQTLDEVKAEKYGLSRTNGAWLSAEPDADPAIFPGSPAELAGLIEGDIIFEINGTEVNMRDNLLSIVQRFKPGDKIYIKLQREEEILEKELTLGQF